MTFHVVTLFPHAFDSYLGESILKRAIEDKKIQVKFYNPRDYTRVSRLRGFARHASISSVVFLKGACPVRSPADSAAKDRLQYSSKSAGSGGRRGRDF